MKLTADMRALPLALRRTPAIKIAIHSAVYRWASEQFGSGAVLDLGCAEGFGSRLLERKDRSIWGVDWDSDLIEIARSENEAIQFVVADCETLDLPLEYGNFDVVLNNALLEHVEHCDRVMAAAVRYLSDSGLMIVGTKNAASCLQDSSGKPLYGNHVREFHRDELAKFLGDYFESVRLYSLRPNSEAASFLENEQALGMERLLVRLGVKELIPPGLRSFVRKRLTGVSVKDIGDLQFEIDGPSDGAPIDDGHYLLAVCSCPRTTAVST